MSKSRAGMTFGEQVNSLKLGAGRALFQRARSANRLAKIATTTSGRRSAYTVKERALNRGIDLGLFFVRGDEEGREFLCRVSPRGGAGLHLPVAFLSAVSVEVFQVRTVLAGLKREVG